VPRAESRCVPLSHGVFVCICAALEQKRGAGGGGWWGKHSLRWLPAPAGLTQSWISPISAPSAVTHRWVFWGVKSCGLLGGLFLRFLVILLYFLLCPPCSEEADAPSHARQAPGTPGGAPGSCFAPLFPCLLINGDSMGKDEWGGRMPKRHRENRGLRSRALIRVSHVHLCKNNVY